MKPNDSNQYDPDVAKSCKNINKRQMQVDTQIWSLAQSKIVQGGPLLLKDSYPCVDNDTCPSDVIDFRLRIAIDANSKTICWNGGGSLVSEKLTEILNLLRGLGL